MNLKQFRSQAGDSREAPNSLNVEKNFLRGAPNPPMATGLICMICRNVIGVLYSVVWIEKRQDYIPGINSERAFPDDFQLGALAI